MDTPLSFRRCSETDIAAARDAYGRVFGAAAPEAVWRRKYSANPAGRALVYAAYDGERLVAFYAQHPLRISFFGEESGIFQGGDAFTEEAFRRRGVYRRLKAMSAAYLKSRRVPFSVGFPNDAGLRANLGVGYLVVGRLRRWVKLLLGVNRPAAAAANEEVRLDDERLAAIWARVRPTDKICGARPAGYLRWRFGPGANVRAWALKDGAGYIVAERAGRGVWIRDLQAPDGERRKVAALVAAAVSYARDTGARHVSFSFLGNRFPWDLIRAGFFPVGRRAPFTLSPYVTPDAAWLEPRNWYITDADRDIEVR